MLTTWTWPTIRAQPANCRECSRSVCPRFIVVLCVFWGIELTQRMRCRKRKRPRQIHMPLDEQIGEDEIYFISERLADTRPSPEDDCRHSELATHLRKCTALLSPGLRR